ncbi:hypothetical protein PLESTF_001693000 [Pleodorina starrii]|nr:hypothetical protein PLESTF_001693000 [Pleodorina starrii]
MLHAAEVTPGGQNTRGCGSGRHQHKLRVQHAAKVAPGGRNASGCGGGRRQRERRLQHSAVVDCNRGVAWGECRPKLRLGTEWRDAAPRSAPEAHTVAAPGRAECRPLLGAAQPTRQNLALAPAATTAAGVTATGGNLGGMLHPEPALAPAATAAAGVPAAGGNLGGMLHMKPALAPAPVTAAGVPATGDNLGGMLPMMPAAGLGGVLGAHVPPAVAPSVAAVLAAAVADAG